MRQRPIAKAAADDARCGSSAGITSEPCSGSKAPARLLSSWHITRWPSCRSGVRSHPRSTTSDGSGLGTDHQA